MAAAVEVFGIPELVEMVLLGGLSAAEVTRARQINSYIKNVIDNSISLRRVMFLEPEPVRETIPFDWTDWYDEDNDVEDTVKETTSVAVMRLHPAIVGVLPEDDDDHYPGSHDTLPLRVDFTQAQWAPGIWSEMLICQPPCTEFILGYDRRPLVDGDQVTLGLVRVYGSTLGSLLTEIQGLQQWSLGNWDIGAVKLYGKDLVDERSMIVRDDRAKKAAAEKEAARTASSKVFGNKQLIERILVCLSPAEITRARQVNSSFKTAIDKSMPLRRAMFLEPELVHEVLPYDYRDYFEDGQDLDKSEAIIDVFTVMRVHPAISAPRKDYDGYIHIKIPEQPWSPGDWEGSLITNPPCPTLRLTYWRLTATPQPGLEMQRYTKPVKGETLGDLMKAISKIKPGVHGEIMLEVPDKKFEEDGSSVVKYARETARDFKLSDKRMAELKAQAVEEAAKDMGKGKGKVESVGPSSVGPSSVSPFVPPSTALPRKQRHRKFSIMMPSGGWGSPRPF